MTGSLISWFDDTIDRFEELEKFIYNYQKYYGKRPTYVSIPPDDYFELIGDINRNHVDVFLRQGIRSSMDLEFQGVPITTSNIIRHGVMTDLHHKPAYKREK